MWVVWRQKVEQAQLGQPGLEGSTLTHTRAYAHTRGRPFGLGPADADTSLRQVFIVMLKALLLVSLCWNRLKTHNAWHVLYIFSEFSCGYWAVSNQAPISILRLKWVLLHNCNCIPEITHSDDDFNVNIVGWDLSLKVVKCNITTEEKAEDEKFPSEYTWLPKHILNIPPHL